MFKKVNIKRVLQVIAVCLLFTPAARAQKFKPKPKPVTPNYLVLSQQMLHSIKADSGYHVYMNYLSAAASDELRKQLNNDARITAFWINVFNGYTQSFASFDKSRLQGNGFFDKKDKFIANQGMSLEQVENDFLGKNHENPATGAKLPSVSKADNRVFFALNRGFKTSPPIQIYTEEDLNTQLDAAVAAYLRKQAVYSSSANTVTLPKSAKKAIDKAGAGKILSILKTEGVVPASASPAFKYAKEANEVLLGNFGE